MRDSVLGIYILQIGLASCLKLMELSVPTHKLVGEEVKLVCKFDMEGDTLYSVKWYRNEQEFYRFVPNDRPKLQIFPQKGIRVERSKSSRQHVFLFDLQLEASGTYRCEVSAEAPSFRTKHEEKVMVVVQEPYHNEIVGNKLRYYTGDLVNVTCYSRGSSPPANLHWKVNNERVFDEVADMEQYRQEGFHLDRPRQRERKLRREENLEERARYARYSSGGLQTTYQIIQPQEAPVPTGIYGRIKNSFEKSERDPHLDTAVSNLQFVVSERHQLAVAGMRLECTASIGQVYWHTTTETCQVSAKPKEYASWITGGSAKTNPQWTHISILLLLPCLTSYQQK